MFDLYKKLNAILTRREKRSFAILLCAILVMASLEVAGIASILPFMQLVSTPDVVQSNRWLGEAYDRFGFEDYRSFVLMVGVLVLTLMTLSKLAGALTKWMQHRFVWASAHSLSTRLLTRYLNQPYEFFLIHEPSTLHKQVIGEVKQLVREVLLPLVRFIAQAVVAIIIFVLLILVDPALAFTVLGTLGGAYALVYFAARRYLLRLGTQRFQLFRSSFKIVAETFSATKSVKVHRSENYFIRKFRIVDFEQSKLQPKYAVIAETPQSFIELIAFGGILGILIYLLAREQNIQDIIPLLTLYAFAGHRLMPSLQQAFNSLTMLRFNRSVLDSVHEDLMSITLPPRRLLPADERRLHFADRVELRNVSFHYPLSEEGVLCGIDLTIEKGTRVAFVGPTGSGKSTLADILLGLIRPTSGEVLIDGTPLSLDNVSSWLGMVGYVPQEVVLIDSSVTRNIAFGVEDDAIDMDRIRHVAGVARIHDFIENFLPDGYETSVGERGVRLSGGQRQRIGLARALYHGPDVLILDEATSSLDGITEDSVMDGLARLGRDLTVVTIAHRIVTVMGCDRIYLLENGRIVDAGRYDDLIQSSTVFRGLARVAL